MVCIRKSRLLTSHVVAESANAALAAFDDSDSDDEDYAPGHANEPDWRPRTYYDREQRRRQRERQVHLE